ncbi:S-adenosyl-L-methionine-dependent methyltransferase [Xylariaceae sp. FL0016]|nr:S-adenosyl-L-methionine-dependent methyltransferase [Xylariaceae sp. FL0016]
MKKAHDGDRKPHTYKQRKRAPAPNPIVAAVTAWLHAQGEASVGGVTPTEQEKLLAETPKRWTVYAPLALLPAGAFAGEGWRRALWVAILREIERVSGTQVTHLAVVEGIPASVRRSHPPPFSPSTPPGSSCPSQTLDLRNDENILRSPTGLRMLHGDFGPDETAAAAAASSAVTDADFDAAFWVSTRQNGIAQTWAPRWTMFSRGNIKEKARLLGFHRGMRDTWAVDMYAGIGYFVFSYAALGMRVLCWELNPWSVEGLRRGALANGWSVRVVRGRELGEDRLEEYVDGGEQIVVFLEDNARATERIGRWRAECPGKGEDVEVLHVNCGLLPRSDLSWDGAWEITRTSEQAWLHLHENVGVADIEKRKGEIETWFADLSRRDGGVRLARVEHVEQVKTFAPGVWHCVFDLYITRSSSIT